MGEPLTTLGSNRQWNQLKSMGRIAPFGEVGHRATPLGIGRLPTDKRTLLLWCCGPKGGYLDKGWLITSIVSWFLAWRWWQVGFWSFVNSIFSIGWNRPWINVSQCFGAPSHRSVTWHGLRLHRANPCGVSWPHLVGPSPPGHVGCF
jgi:hypothetical protein